MSDVTYVTELPMCSLHWFHDGSQVVAGYDARLPSNGRWASVCQSCFTANGCKLGTGNGQKYIVGEAPPINPDDVIEALEDGDIERAQELIGDGDLHDYM